MQPLLQQHLRRRAGLEPPLVAGSHLDEDSLTAFTEGYLTEPETTPIITHLVDCAFCRRTTARLINLAAELGETSSQATSPVPAPEAAGRLRRLLDRLAARVLPASDDVAVFAYQSRPEEADRPEEIEPAPAPDSSAGEPGKKES